jgi:hypothetical protein
LPIFDDFQATVAASVVASFPVDYTAVVIVAIGNLGDAIVQHPELQWKVNQSTNHNLAGALERYLETWAIEDCYVALVDAYLELQLVGVIRLVSNNLCAPPMHEYH